MYILFIILSSIGSGRALTSSQIQFPNKALCEEAAKQIQKEGLPHYVSGNWYCLKAK